MRTIKFNRFIFFVLLVLIIGIMGVGYANWKQDVTVIGKISTGKVSVDVLDNNNLYIVDNDIVINTSTTKSGVVRIPFTIINNGTIPIKLNQKSDNIDFCCDELLVGGTKDGFIITNVGEDKKGCYNQEVEGAIEMIALNGGWKESVNINGVVEVNIPLPKKEKIINDIIDEEGNNPPDTTPIDNEQIIDSTPTPTSDTDQVADNI